MEKKQKYQTGADHNRAINLHNEDNVSINNRVLKASKDQLKVIARAILRLKEITGDDKEQQILRLLQEERVNVRSERIDDLIALFLTKSAHLSLVNADTDDCEIDNLNDKLKNLRFLSNDAIKNLKKLDASPSDVRAYLDSISKEFNINLNPNTKTAAENTYFKNIVPRKMYVSVEDDGPAPIFIKNVYSEWLNGEFTRADLRKLDPKAEMALRNWERKHGRAPLNLPTKKELNDKRLAEPDDEISQHERLDRQRLRAARRHSEKRRLAPR